MTNRIKELSYVVFFNGVFIEAENSAFVLMIENAIKSRRKAKKTNETSVVTKNN